MRLQCLPGTTGCSYLASYYLAYPVRCLPYNFPDTVGRFRTRGMAPLPRPPEMYEVVPRSLVPALNNTTAVSTVSAAILPVSTLYTGCSERLPLLYVTVCYCRGAGAHAPMLANKLTSNSPPAHAPPRRRRRNGGPYRWAWASSTSGSTSTCLRP